jgi:hypothetical protein
MRSLATFLVLIPMTASASQILTCRFPDPAITDQIKITLQSPDSGTFAYVAPDPNHSSSDSVLKVKRIEPESTTLAKFEVQSSAVQMTFKMPVAVINQNSSAFKASLSSSIPGMDLSQDQDLACDSMMRN